MRGDDFWDLASAAQFYDFSGICVAGQRGSAEDVHKNELSPNTLRLDEEKILRRTFTLTACGLLFLFSD